MDYLIRNDISNIVQFATEFEDEFVKIVVDENYKQIQATQKKNLEALNKMLARDKELDTLCSAVSEILTLSFKAFVNTDLHAARDVEPLEQVIDNLKAKSRDDHIRRLKNGE